MDKMQTYTLKFSKAEGCWNVYDKKGKEVACYDSKSQAMKGGELKKVVGKAGGIVKIMAKDGKKVGQRAYSAK